MRNPARLYLFAFHSMALFTSFAGVLVVGLALILPDAGWDKVGRGAVLFLVFRIIAKFADKALQESGGI